MSIGFRREWDDFTLIAWRKAWISHISVHEALENQSLQVRRVTLLAKIWQGSEHTAIGHAVQVIEVRLYEFGSG